jgi:hypothetical protein
VNRAIFSAALATPALGRISILEAQGFQLHPPVGCELSLRNIIDSQIGNQNADTAGCISVRAAAIDLVDVVPAMAMTKLDHASNRVTASPVTTAWDSRFTSLDKPNQPGPVALISLASTYYVSGTSILFMSKLLIKKMPVVAPRGIHSARFVGAEIVTQNNAGKSCNLLVPTLELFETKDGAGNPFKISDTYNLGGRGAAAFSEDYASWSGIALTPEELNDFDTDSLLLNKLVKVEIGHRKDGKELVPVIVQYLPHLPATE